MKRSILLLLTLLSSTVHANDLIDLINGEKPACSSALVRLSKKPIPCIKDILEDGQFDIPNLELDFDDLDDVFNGAESSGGHVIGPMGHPRRSDAPATPFPVTLRCQAKLLSDGGKRVSFLSKQSFTLNSLHYTTYLFADRWQHAIVEGANLNPSNSVEVPISPKVELKNYSVTLGYNNNSKKLSLTACEGNLKTNGDSTVAACSEVEFNRYSYKVQARLKTLILKKNIRIQKTLDISCRQ
ncbi:MAG: hypothetical protein ACJAT2_002751 [Bacteriovoracaceae bacterium]|jgi:hypothetical protein